jgi:cell division protein ZapB
MNRITIGPPDDLPAAHGANNKEKPRTARCPHTPRPLTVSRVRSIVETMTSKQINSPQKLDLDLLTQRLEELIRLCERLREENNRLKAVQIQMQAAQTRLADKNELSRARLESMIMRLKTLEVEL